MKLENIFSRRNRILLRELVITDFKLRYQGSILGYIWSLLKPLLLFAILYTVFIVFMKFDMVGGHGAVQLLIGIVLWTFFVEATNQGMTAIVSRGDLIRKINFPKYIIVISGTVSALINLLLNFIIIAIFMVINGVELSWTLLLFPLIVLELYVFALGIAFLFSALFVRYRDISHIWEVLLQGLFYATPIIYPVSLVLASHPLVAKILLLNPLAQIIQDARYVTVSHGVITLSNTIQNPFAHLVPIGFIGAVVVMAVYYFKKHQKYFAENV